MSTHPSIVDAEEVLVRYERYLREFTSPNVPRGWIDELTGTIESLLDLLAQYHVDENYGVEDEGPYEPDETLVTDYWDDDDHFPEDQDETDYEGEA